MEYILKNSNLDIQDNNILFALLQSRGINDVMEYINGTQNILDNMNLLGDTEIAADFILNGIKSKKKFFLQVDSDTDGVTSSAILYLYLKAISDGDINITWRMHVGKQHGVIPNTVPNDIDIVLIPDAGTNQIKEMQELMDRGIQTIIIDHHLPEGNELPVGCIINTQIGNYPNKSLSGAGVVYKFCHYLDHRLGTNYAIQFADLASLGIIADQMDLRSLETRAIIKLGLKNPNNPALLALMQKQAYVIKTLDPKAIGWSIAPLINALIRVGTPEQKVTLFEAFIDGNRVVKSTKRGATSDEVEYLAVQNARNCINAKSRQDKKKEDALEAMKITISNNNLDKNRILCITTSFDDDDSDAVENNLTGLIAGSLTSLYKLPALVLRDAGDKWKGSARNVTCSEFPDFKQFCSDSGLIDMVQGHANAFGFHIKKNKLDDFITYANEKLANINFNEGIYEVDFICKSLTNVNQLIMEIARGSELWGRGIEEPIIVLENVEINQNAISTMGKNLDTTKIILKNGLDCIKFKDKKLIAQLKTLPDNFTATLVGTATINDWMGAQTPQFQIIEIGNIKKNFVF
jgi:single-stranded-DNA-specific exonuclease